MITGTINTVGVNSQDSEKVKFTVDVFNDMEHVKINLGEEEVLVKRDSLMKVFDMLNNAKPGGKDTGIRLKKGNYID